MKQTSSAEPSRVPQASWLLDQLGGVITQNRLRYIVLNKNSAGVRWWHGMSRPFPIGNKP
jgi:hypothetical protein